MAYPSDYLRVTSNKFEGYTDIIGTNDLSNNQHLTGSENNDPLINEETISSDTTGLLKHDESIQFLKDSYALLSKNSRTCSDIGFDRILDAFIVLEHTNINPDGATIDCIMHAIEEESRVDGLMIESLLEDSASNAHEYQLLLMSAKESFCDHDKGSKFDSFLKSPDLCSFPKHIFVVCDSIFTSNLKGGSFCCLFNFIIALEKVSFMNLTGSNLEMRSIIDRYGSEYFIDTTDFELKTMLLPALPEPFQQPSLLTPVSSLEFINNYLNLNSKFFLLRSKLSLKCSRCSCVSNPSYDDHFIMSLDLDVVASAPPRSITDLIRYGA